MADSRKSSLVVKEVAGSKFDAGVKPFVVVLNDAQRAVVLNVA